VLLAELVATSSAVAATRARSTKAALLAELLRRVPPEEAAVAAGFLVGSPRQGRVGIGWSALAGTNGLGAAGAPSLSLADVDAAIDRIGQTTGEGSLTARRRLVEELFAHATVEEADFLRRLLLGELRQGALEGVMAEAIAAAAGVPVSRVRRAAMLAGDLAHVAEVALQQGEAGLAGVGLRVLRPVLPMLAATSATVAEAIAQAGRSSVEWKLDGARLQAHRLGGTVRLFTRSLNDVTARLPGIVELVASLPVREVILDGEVFGAGVDDERADPFQETMSSFSRHSPAVEANLQVRFFDVLHLDGQDLIDLPLEQRLEVLGRVAGEWRIPGVLTADAAEAEAFAADALARGHEGVMVKSIDSRYEAGRRGSAWRKVKPVRTFDLVVLAAEWGHGRRRGWLSNLHLGARDPSTGGYVMVGKTFKGLTDQLLAWQTEALLELETGRSGITVAVRPQLVVEIALDGVQRSPRYPGGLALRFARVKRYRLDKSAAEADTIGALRSLLPDGNGAAGKDTDARDAERSGRGLPEDGNAR
jgi:DNA ligase-1